MKIVYKLCLLILICCVSFPSLNVVRASGAADLPTKETEPVIKDNEGLRLQMIQNTQDPGTRIIQFDLVLTSKIDSDRVQISWQFTGALEPIDAKTTTLTVKPNQTYTVSATARGRESSKAALAEALATVEAFEAAGTFTATARKSFGLLDDGTVYPVSDAYNVARVIYYVKTGAIWIVGGILTVVVLLFIYRKFREWFSKIA